MRLRLGMCGQGSDIGWRLLIRWGTGWVAAHGYAGWPELVAEDYRAEAAGRVGEGGSSLLRGKC